MLNRLVQPAGSTGELLSKKIRNQIYGFSDEDIFILKIGETIPSIKNIVFYHEESDQYFQSSDATGIISSFSLSTDNILQLATSVGSFAIPALRTLQEIDGQLLISPLALTYGISTSEIAILRRDISLDGITVAASDETFRSYYVGSVSGNILDFTETNDGLSLITSNGSYLLPDAKTILSFSGVSLNAALFGVHATTEPGFSNFDSTVQLNRAFEFAKANGITKVISPSPIYLSSEYGRFQGPGDDGTVYPGWVSAGTDTIINAETVQTIPYCVKIPGGVSFSAADNQPVAINGPWLVGSSPVNKDQLVCIFQTSGNKYNGTVSSKINVKITGFMVGRIVEGTLVNGEDSVSYWSCGIAEIIEGVERIHYLYVNLNNCIAGIIHGGWWTMRSRTQSWAYMPGSYGDYPNNYTYNGTTGGARDVFPLGWTDFCKIDWIIGEQYRAAYATRALLIDQFFDAFFYKDSNSALTSAGGRASNTTAGTAAVFPSYRGVAGRMLSVLSRYGRPGSGYQIDFAKTFYQHRTPFYSSEGIGSVGYYIGNIVAEGIGCTDPNLGLVTGNYFGKDYQDPYRAANYGIGYMCAQGFYIRGWSGGSNCQKVRITSTDLNQPGSFNLNPIYHGQGAGGSNPVLFRISMFDEAVNGGYRVPYTFQETGVLLPTGGAGNTEMFNISVGNTKSATVTIGSTTITGLGTNKINYRQYGKLIKFRLILFISGEYTYPAGNINITGLPSPLAGTESYYQLSVNQIVSIPNTKVPTARFVDVNTISFYDGVGSTRLDGSVMNSNANGKANYFYIDISGEYETA